MTNRAYYTIPIGRVNQRFETSIVLVFIPCFLVFEPWFRVRSTSCADITSLTGFTHCLVIGQKGARLAWRTHFGDDGNSTVGYLLYHRSSSILTCTCIRRSPGAKMVCITFNRFIYAFQRGSRTFGDRARVHRSFLGRCCSKTPPDRVLVCNFQAHTASLQGIVVWRQSLRGC